MRVKQLNRTGTLTALAIMAVLLGATCALAQGPAQGRAGCSRLGPGHGSGMGRGMLAPGFAEKLGLTADQQTAIDAINQQTRQDNLELRKQLMRLRNEKQGEMLKDDPAQKTVLDLTAKIGALRTQMQVNRAKAHLEIRKQLTPEQRDMMLTMRSQRGMRHGGHAGFSGRGSHGGVGQGPRSGCDGSGPGKCVGRGNMVND